MINKPPEVCVVFVGRNTYPLPCTDSSVPVQAARWIDANKSRGDLNGRPINAMMRVRVHRCVQYSQTRVCTH